MPKQMKFIGRIARWYGGEEVVHPAIKGSNYILLPRQEIRHHWTAKLARELVAFYLRHCDQLDGSLGRRSRVEILIEPAPHRLPPIQANATASATR